MSVGSPLARLGLLWRTARHLRPRQLAAQLGHRVRGPARRPRASLSDGLSGVAAHARGWPAPRADGALAPEGVVMLARPPHEPRAGGWTPAGRSALWTYTLHYHGWIARAGDDDPRPLALVERWIADHPRGVGWEPYLTSMRALQWLHLLIRGAGLGASNKMSEETCSRVLRSLAAQLRHLEANLERHLDGNHLWTNLAALASAGLALDGPLAARLRRRWLPALVAVADEQLAGGVHRERAPSYHCLLAHQLGGALWLARRAPEVAPGSPTRSRDSWPRCSTRCRRSPTPTATSRCGATASGARR
ncbi:MAG: hypothetical protein H6713_19000 [Myxococcales bacterium]|nr:hypothetical protein [Myxococcales bacterium]